MNAKEKILAAVAANQPQSTKLPLIDHRGVTSSVEDLVSLFTQNLQTVGGHLQRIRSIADLRTVINDARAAGGSILNLIPQAGEVDPIPASLDALASLQQVFMLGSVAIAENGAVWIPESTMLGRILPFITDQLILVIDEKQLVPTMHEAYERIKVDEDGFGVFIAGPSKTADIEQSLVIGAHGARKLVVVMIGADPQ
ncbi:MAG: lactate utilization protein B/C [Citrobacter freundii]|nr:MAG: lactate utilization protein B/C [Citrobacter freundii]